MHGHLATVGADTYAASATTGDNTHFTRVDAGVDVDTGYETPLKSLIIASSALPTFPTKHFSVWWRGYLTAPTSALYRVYIEAFEASFVELSINGAVLIKSEFQSDDVLSIG